MTDWETLNSCNRVEIKGIIAADAWKQSLVLDDENKWMMPIKTAFFNKQNKKKSINQSKKLKHNVQWNGY